MKGIYCVPESSHFVGETALFLQTALHGIKVLLAGNQSFWEEDDFIDDIARLVTPLPVPT